MVDYRNLSETLARFAGESASDHGPDEALRRLGGAVAALLPTDGVAVLLHEGDDRLRCAAATDDRTGEIEQAQLSLRQGPGVDAARNRRTVSVHDLCGNGGGDYPRFRAAAVERGARATIAVPLSVTEGECVGALDLYRDRVGPLHADDLAAARLLATVAAGHVLNTRRIARARSTISELREGHHSRALIEQAKGKLSAELGTDLRSAFEILRRHARRRRMRLRLLAQFVIEGRVEAQDLVSADPVATRSRTQAS